MITIPDDVIARLPPSWGLDILNRRFDQSLAAAAGLPVRFMQNGHGSGMQPVKTDLEADCLEQVATALGVYDAITHAAFRYEIGGRSAWATVDVVVQLFEGIKGQPERYLLDVREDGLCPSPEEAESEAERLDAVRALGLAWGAECRALSATEIRTSHLAAVRDMRYRRPASNRATGRIMDLVDRGTTVVGELIAHVEKMGLSRPRARDAVFSLLRLGVIRPDPPGWAGDTTVVRAATTADRDHAREPFLKILMEAPRF